MNEELEWLKHANETIERLKAELAQAKAENARLVAALKTIVKAWPHPLASSAPSPAMYAEQQLRDCSALGDLLAPTIELLERARHKNLGTKHSDTEFDAHLNEELSRLRSITKGKP